MPESASWEILRLNRSHDRDGFDCGVRLLNEWLKHLAGQYERRDLARTYVAVEIGQPKVLG